MYLDENQRLIQELGECKFKLLSLGNEQTEAGGNETREENERLREEVETLKMELEQARKMQQKLWEKEEESKNMESVKRNAFGSFGSIGSNHRDSTGYMVLKNPTSEQGIPSKSFLVLDFPDLNNQPIRA